MTEKVDVATSYHPATDTVALTLMREEGEDINVSLTRTEFVKSAYEVERHAFEAGKEAIANPHVPELAQPEHEFHMVIGNCLMTEDGHSANQRFTQTIEQRLNDGWALHGSMQMFPIDQPGWFKLVQPMSRIK